jgi:antitoxin component YwqK of YwqJK toxin-antitoxin module
MKSSPVYLLIYLFLAVFIFTSCSNAVKEYYPDGKLKSVVHMKGGKYYGRSVYYNPSGDIQLECFYKDNLLQGPLIRYFNYKKKKDEQNYDKGNLDGLSTEWYEDGGKLSEATFMNGILNGPYREYHNNNRLKVQGQYLKGYFTGKWLYYDLSGDIRGEGQFIHGTGKQRSFYQDGKVSHEIHYKDNLKDGEEIEYDLSGKVISIKIFKNDSLINNLR